MFLVDIEEGKVDCNEELDRSFHFRNNLRLRFLKLDWEWFWVSGFGALFAKMAFRFGMLGS